MEGPLAACQAEEVIFVVGWRGVIYLFCDVCVLHTSQGVKVCIVAGECFDPGGVGWGGLEGV